MLDVSHYTAVCEVAGCDRKALAKRLCNAHYIRKRNGSDMYKPIRVENPSRGCKVDGCNGKHYSNDFCLTHWRTWHRYNVKRTLISDLGGKCMSCGNVFHPAAFDFHHVDPKSKAFSITEKIARLPLEKLREETSKCILLCANCHRIHHAGEGL